MGVTRKSASSNLNFRELRGLRASGVPRRAFTCERLRLKQDFLGMFTSLHGNLSFRESSGESSVSPAPIGLPRDIFIGLELDLRLLSF